MCGVNQVRNEGVLFCFFTIILNLLRTTKKFILKPMPLIMILYKRGSVSRPYSRSS